MMENSRKKQKPNCLFLNFYSNGLKTLIPNSLLFGFLGYPFVLPDMIGGNGYDGKLPDAELFIRWMQANTFLPAIQFSYVPWEYSEKITETCRNLVNLHEKYFDKFYALAAESVNTGAPIIRPLWWIDENHDEALRCNDEFLVGNDTLVAPVLEQGARNRTIYFPPGKWKSQMNVSGEIYEGPKSVLVDVDLYELAWFILQE